MNRLAVSRYLNDAAAMDSEHPTLGTTSRPDLKQSVALGIKRVDIVVDPIDQKVQPHPVVIKVLPGKATHYLGCATPFAGCAIVQHSIGWLPARECAVNYVIGL